MTIVSQNDLHDRSRIFAEDNPLQGEGRHAAAARSIPCLLQFLLAPRECTPAPTTARAHTRPGVGQAVAAVHARHGRGTDRSRLAGARGAAVSRAGMAPASGGMSKPRWWEAAREGGLVGHVCPHGLL